MASKCCLLTSAVLTCSLLVLLTEAVPTSRSLHHRLQRRSGMRLCGRMLVEALATICMSDYYGPSHLKRNFAYNSGIDSDWDDSSAENLLDPQMGLDFFSVNQLTRGARGIADECCAKSCSFLQLMSYCGPSLGK